MNNSKQVYTSIGIIIAAVVCTALVAFIGIDQFFGEGLLTFVLWGVVGLIATGFGCLVSFIVSCFTEADLNDIIMAVSPVVLALLSGIWIINENRGFMGYIGAGVIFYSCTIPLIITSVVWIGVAVARSVRRRVKEAETVSKKA
ncbi:MAG: hypothetical protein K6G68_03495 [Oscillospiraceae bacterium]|nr:hypothetical protein [Oscillospiraceae bacterium]